MQHLEAQIADNKGIAIVQQHRGGLPGKGILPVCASWSFSRI